MGRSTIQRLPTELKAMVATSIDDPETLKSLARVDKDFNRVIKADQAKLCAALFRKHIGDDFFSLGVAVARSRGLQVPRAFYGLPRPALNLTVNDIVRFVDVHFPPKVSDTIVAADWKMDLKLCAELFAFHKVVDNYADIFCQRPDFEGIGVDEESDNLEKHRVRKALYILQLLSNLFPRGWAPKFNFEQMQLALKPAWAHLLTRFAPWELQQVRAAHQLLVRHVNRGKPMFHVQAWRSKTNSTTVVQADVLTEGGVSEADQRLMFTFVSNEGLFVLEQLEDMGNLCGTLDALRYVS